MIKAEDIKFSYSKNEIILKGIDTEISRGEFVGIIGPNASGKSTLLKNISKSLTADSGTVLLEDRFLNKYSNEELAKKMAVVPQNTEINFNFSVYDIIMMGRHPYQKKWAGTSEKDREILREVMELTDTWMFRKKSVNNLSGGEKQRVIIARALAQKPEILLLDEPTSSLDINYQGEIYDLLKYLNQKLELTIITVSHDLNLTAQYCQKLILLKEGKIYSAGSADSVLTEKNIKAVYDAEVMIRKNPLSDRPFITLIPKNSVNKKTVPKKDFKIHVIGGGGTAQNFLHKLDQKGYNLSVGVVNIGDADWQTAKELNLEIVEAPPFVDICQKEIDKNENLIKKSDLIILSDLPFGHGNLANLKTLLEFPDKKKILLDNIEIKKRDYIKGKAENIWNKLLERDNNIILLDKKDELIKEVEKVEMECNI